MGDVEGQIAQHLLVQNQRALVSDQAAKVDHCDGSTAHLVKKFLRELETVPIALRFEVFERCARDSLLREGLLWVAQHAGQQQWALFKTHLVQAFISQDAEGAFRKEFYCITKQPHESVVSYNRRFRDIATEAYPIVHDAQGQVLPRNIDQTEILVKTYASGLQDKQLVNKVITPDWPVSIDQAMERTAQTEKVADNLERLGLHAGPEAMEVDAVLQARPMCQPSYSQMEKEVHSLKAQYGKLENKIDRLLDRPLAQAPTSPKPRPATSSWPEKETRSCYNCGKQGHLSRDCRSKQRTPAGQVPSDRQWRRKPPQSSPVAGLGHQSQ